jgi:hypothetical protein
MKVSVTINDKPVKMEITGSEILLDALRNEGYVSVERGCENGDCGTCAVLLDGKAVCACLMMAGQVEGRAITTCEESGDPINPHPQLAMERLIDELAVGAREIGSYEKPLKPQTGPIRRGVGVAALMQGSAGPISDASPPPTVEVEVDIETGLVKVLKYEAAEISIDGALPAISNAIYDACGVRMTNAPFTPERVLQALREKAGEPPLQEPPPRGARQAKRRRS